MRPKIRIGAINWDAGLPADTYFGHNTINSLGHDKFASRLPYYAKRDENGKYYIPERTHEEYNEELRIAAEYGIDFFMYCWYPEGEAPRTVGTERYDFLAPNLHELNRGRKMYQASPINKMIKMCAIIIGCHAYSEADLLDLIKAMGEEYYEKKDGRPLVFFFGGYQLELITAFRKLAKRHGCDPYIVFMNNGVESSNGNYSEADAVSNYGLDPYVLFIKTDAKDSNGAHSELVCKVTPSDARFETVAEVARNNNENRKKYGVPIIPVLSAGWNPMPRVENHCPWGSYEDRPYPPAPTAKQMEAATEDFLSWINENSEVANTGYGVVFAWNEFEEGAYLCPTLAADGSPNYEILRGLKRGLGKEK